MVDPVSALTKFDLSKSISNWGVLRTSVNSNTCFWLSLHLVDNQVKTFRSRNFLNLLSLPVFFIAYVKVKFFLNAESSHKVINKNWIHLFNATSV